MGMREQSGIGKTEVRGSKAEFKMITEIYLPALVKHPEVFTKYRGMHKGSDIVLFGTGYTVKFFSPMRNVINMGMNRIIVNKNIDFQYFVACDNDPDSEIFESILSSDRTMIKFFGICNSTRGETLIPEYMRNRRDVETIYVSAERGTINDAISEREQPYKFPIDISVSPLKSYGTTYYVMMQIALWMHPKRIYLVGADCFGGNGAHGIKVCTENLPRFDYRWFIKGWKYMKDFIHYNYPDIEVISINPVGLRGLFTDQYTDSYKEYVRSFR